MNSWRIDSAGPDALMVRFGDRVDPALVPLIRAAADRLAGPLRGQIRDLVPSYTTLMVCYDPLQNDFHSLAIKIHALLTNLERNCAETGRLVEIPVWYHPAVGPDLERVAETHQITIEEVVQRHSQCEYHVFAIGFAPGFAYMGPVAETLATPRLDTPRERVPAGAVALAERQTAVYPIATPGGWNILGRSAVKMFDRDLEGLCPVQTGDRVRFVAVDRETFLDAGGEL